LEWEDIKNPLSDWGPTYVVFWWLCCCSVWTDTCSEVSGNQV